jgi:hypothetical protein
MSEHEENKTKPGVCVPWQEKRKEFAEILGDEKIVQKVWEQTDLLAYLYIWACLIQF